MEKIKLIETMSEAFNEVMGLLGDNMPDADEEYCEEISERIEAAENSFAKAKEAIVAELENEPGRKPAYIVSRRFGTELDGTSTHESLEEAKKEAFNYVLVWGICENWHGDSLEEFAKTKKKEDVRKLSAEEIEEWSEKEGYDFSFGETGAYFWDGGYDAYEAVIQKM